MPLRVLLASDHSGLRESLHDLLEAQPDFMIIASPTTEEECLREAAAWAPEVVVIDGGCGLAAERLVAALHRVCPDTAIIVLAMQADRPHVHAALAAGARGYLLKETAAREMGAALLAVTNGRTYLGANLS
jgi:DNA-binding NarL/FixJ family response regulator